MNCIDNEIESYVWINRNNWANVHEQYQKTGYLEEIWISQGLTLVELSIIEYYVLAVITLKTRVKSLRKKETSIRELPEK